MVVYNYKDQFTYILISELPEKQQKPFTAFMYGQTVPLIFDENKKEYLSGACYSWDYENWVNSVKGKPTFWD